MIILYDETDLPEDTVGLTGVELQDVLYARGEAFYESIPEIEYEEPVIAIAEISDGCGNLMPSCWELSGHMLASCFEPIDSFHRFYVDDDGDLRSSGMDLRNGISFYMFRVFKPEIGHDEQQWLIDLINSAVELSTDIKEEIIIWRKNDT